SGSYCRESEHERGQNHTRRNFKLAVCKHWSEVFRDEVARDLYAERCGDKDAGQNGRKIARELSASEDEGDRPVEHPEEYEVSPVAHSSAEDLRQTYEECRERQKGKRDAYANEIEIPRHAAQQVCE